MARAFNSVVSLVRRVAVSLTALYVLYGALSVVLMVLMYWPLMNCFICYIYCGYLLAASFIIVSYSMYNTMG